MSKEYAVTYVLQQTSSASFTLTPPPGDYDWEVVTIQQFGSQGTITVVWSRSLS